MEREEPPGCRARFLADHGGPPDDSGIVKADDDRPRSEAEQWLRTRTANRRERAIKTYRRGRLVHVSGVIGKRQWGAFYGTELDLQLRRRGIDTILLAGISTNIGVESTARDAYERGYEQVFVEDAMTARDAGEHAHTVRLIFPRIGRVRSTADVLAALEVATRPA